MSILEIYLLGVVAAAVHIIWFEYQFDHNKQLLAIIVTIWRFNGGKPKNS